MLLSEKTYCYTQLKPRKGKDIKWILIENIRSLFWGIFLNEKTVNVFNQYPFNIPTAAFFLPFDFV